MISDEGLSFHLVFATADGALHRRDTDNRRELLAWIRQHRDAGETVVEIGMAARENAVETFRTALHFGAARLATKDLP